ncbi:mechanosensitive ion channel domain-containing protein [Roseivirga pacifica]|uniref:mechanosensitive ion channel domain-containing protein n=1 Tax=Roseivirga pacifica TaxID=1267423 RepID=UPI003BAA98D8
MLEKVPTNIKRLIHPLSNAICGMVLKVFKPFKHGDFLEVRGKLGAVKFRGIRKTTLASIDGKEIELNNTVFYTGPFHNLTAKNIVQLDLKVQVKYQNDMTALKQTIMDFLAQSPHILKTPTPKIKAGKLSANYLELNISPWCTLNNYDALNLTIKPHLMEHLDKQGYLANTALHKNKVRFA